MAIEHQPPHGFKLPYHEKLIFLAGPIQGAPNWQGEAIELLNTNFHVANPRRDGYDESFDKDKQIEWEWDQLERAALHGGIIFWFAAQDFDLPYEEGRAYAQTTRIEFGEVFGWEKYNPAINIAFGIDPDYEGGNGFYMRKKVLKFGIPVRDNLPAVCHDILRDMKS
jgi:hypothetical protein